MSCPPLLLRIRFRSRNNKFRLWLPLFLVIPLVLAFVIVLSPVLLVSVVILWPIGWGKRLLLIMGVAFKSLCALRGLEVDVQHRDEGVFIAIV